MVFANNAIYCPDGVAVDASGISEATLAANYVSGRLIGVRIDDSGFWDGLGVSAAFVNLREKDFRPKPGSPLIGKADTRYAAKLEFNGMPRQPAFDVGAFESEGSGAKLGDRYPDHPVVGPQR